MKNTYEATDRYAEVDGVKIHYNEAGSGPAFFGFHGGGPGANAWDNTKHNLDDFAEHFQTILMDMPGYGYSDKNAEPAQGESLDRFWARMIKGLMDLKGIEKAHLFGSSQSGPTVLRFGLEYPDRVGRIILQSSSPGGGNLFTPSPPEGIKALGVYANSPTRENMEKMMHLFIPKDELCTEEMIEARFKAAQIPGHLEARARNSASRNSDLRPEIGRLKAPVLVVWGHQDRMVPWEGAISCLQLIPDVRIHVWGGGSGHFVEYEHATEFSRLVIDFLTL
jgi:pimeloyl-ACP methyl ester carboxylesterase